MSTGPTVDVCVHGSTSACVCLRVHQWMGVSTCLPVDECAHGPPVDGCVHGSTSRCVCPRVHQWMCVPTVHQWMGVSTVHQWMCVCVLWPGDFAVVDVVLKHKAMKQ